MDKSLFNYELPEKLIAQKPLANRSSSRMMVLDHENKGYEHKVFSDILDYFQKGDCLVINDTKVIPARLIGTKEKGSAKVELLLLKRIDKARWECIVYPGKRLKPGIRAIFGEGKLVCEIEEVLNDGNRIVKFEYFGIFEEILDELGQMPLPPYIAEKLEDKTRYQTVYAKNEGSAAAPTAGLHFTDSLLKELRNKGVIIANLTLHVGLGTFRPVKEENIFDHKMHSEYCEILEAEADKINNAKASGGKIIAVGTTSVRTLESFNKDGKVYPVNAETDIFIYPGYDFKIVDAIVTNFHLPESTLMMLISAFAGRDFVLDAYNEAVKQEYRFFSFGDAMLIL